MNVLVVDDDEEIRMIVDFVLTAEGHEVREAAHGAAARARCAEQVPDVLLVDVMLGEEDGIALGAELAEQYAVRLVYLTAAVRPEQHERMAAAGPAGILTKPFDPTTLADRLRTLLES